MKWGPGCKIWDCSIILHYFAENLTCMLTLGLRSYRSSNLVLDLKMWEKSESNLPVWTGHWYRYGICKVFTMKVGELWDRKTNLESIATFFTKKIATSPWSGSSNEIICILAVQEAAKLQEVKVEGPKKFARPPHASNFLG